MFGAANGSVWETVKIMALPYLCWSIVELCFLRLPLKNFVVARVTGLYVMTAGTIAFRLLYAGILGTSYAWADILGFAAFAALGFLASSKVMAADSNKIRPWFPAAAFALALFIAMYLTFTVNPSPYQPVFGFLYRHLRNPAQKLRRRRGLFRRVKRNLIVFLPDCFCFILEKCLLFS